MGNISPIWIMLLALVVALVPLAVSMMTSYIKMSVVFGMFRSGLGAQQVPGNMTVMALSLALTLYVMSPVIELSISSAEKLDFKPMLSTPSLSEAKKLLTLFDPWRSFLVKHAGKREVQSLVSLAKGESSQAPAEDELRVLVPAFLLSELKEGFAMGFVLLLPFLAIDLIVANILAGMGMYMVSPVMISLPLKLLLFVVTDGWILLSRGLVLSYN